MYLPLIPIYIYNERSTLPQHVLNNYCPIAPTLPTITTTKLHKSSIPKQSKTSKPRVPKTLITKQPSGLSPPPTNDNTPRILQYNQ